MSLRFKLLDERNDKTIVEIDTYEFYNNEDRILRAQIINNYDNQPYFIAAGGTFKFRFLKNDNTFEDIDGEIQTNRSVVQCELDQTKTAAYVSGNIAGEITEGTDKRAVKSENVLKKLNKDSN